MSEFCPRCGEQRPEPEHEDQPTLLNDAGELVPDSDWLDPGRLAKYLDGWVETEGGTVVCPDCATQAETWRDQESCIRCGLDQDDEERGIEAGGWLNPDNPASNNLLVCPGCATKDEERASVLAFFELVLKAAETTRGEGEALRHEHFEPAVVMMRQRAVPNRLHSEYPINPLSDDPQPWDTVSKELWLSIVECSNLWERAGASNYSDAERRDYHQEFERLAEDTLRRYVAEVRREKVA